MTMTAHDIMELLKQAKYDLSVTQTRVGEAMKGLASLPDVGVAEVFRCVPCGQVFKSTFSLDEHNWRKHDASLPTHMADLERATLGEVIGA